MWLSISTYTSSLINPILQTTAPKTTGPPNTKITQPNVRQQSQTSARQVLPPAESGRLFLIGRTDQADQFAGQRYFGRGCSCWWIYLELGDLCDVSTAIGFACGTLTGGNRWCLEIMREFLRVAIQKSWFDLKWIGGWQLSTFLAIFQD